MEAPRLQSSALRQQILKGLIYVGTCCPLGEAAQITFALIGRDTELPLSLNLYVLCGFLLNYDPGVPNTSLEH